MRLVHTIGPCMGQMPDTFRTSDAAATAAAPAAPDARDSLSFHPSLTCLYSRTSSVRLVRTMGPCMGQMPDTTRASEGSEEIAVRASSAEEEARSRLMVERKETWLQTATTRGNHFEVVHTLEAEIRLRPKSRKSARVAT